MQTPLVTVYTLIYNTNPNYIIEAIKSVQHNNYPFLQHIIVDDGSTDLKSVETVKTWIGLNNYECIFIENKKNLGISQSINEVIKVAKGKYILPCCDDRLLPNRIWGDIELLEKSSEHIALVFSICQNINAKGEKQGFFSPTLISYDENSDTYDYLLKRCFLKAPSVTIKLSAIKHVGGYDNRYLIEDYPMWLRLAQFGYKFKYRPELTTEYRINPNGFTQSRKNQLIEEDIKVKLDFSINARHKIKVEKYIFKQYSMDYKIGKILLISYQKKYDKTFFLYLVSIPLPKFLTIKIINLYFKINDYESRT